MPDLRSPSWSGCLDGVNVAALALLARLAAESIGDLPGTRTGTLALAALLRRSTSSALLTRA